MSINEERQNFINRFGYQKLKTLYGKELLQFIALPKSSETLTNQDLQHFFGQSLKINFSSMYQCLEYETPSFGLVAGPMDKVREIYYSAADKTWYKKTKQISPEQAVQEAEAIKEHLITVSTALQQNNFLDFFKYANKNIKFFSSAFIHKYLYICFPQWILLDFHKQDKGAYLFYKSHLKIKDSALFSLENYFYQKNPSKDLTGIKEQLEKEFGLYTSAKTTLNIKEEKEKIFPLNQILYGPPGTGKTYHTITKAVEIIDGQINPDYAEAKKRFDELKAKGQIKFITFHQNYSYEDFMVGIRPDLQNGQISYKLYEGPFKKIADEARKIENKDKKYVLIIDEINRGNISKIFGELITLIEADKRAGNKHALSAPLLYQDKEFSVPNNLYIIGTMNTADKSIALVDIALRRRFVFEEMMPKADLLNPVEGFDLPEWFSKLNQKITDLIDKDHQIGHSYFIGKSTKEELHHVFYQCILPLLNEYFYGEPEKLAKIIPGFMENNKLKSKLSIDDFMQALNQKEGASNEQQNNNEG